MSLRLAPGLGFGLMTALFDRAQVRETTALLEDLGMDALWVGDHVAFTTPIPDPLLQLAQVAAFSDRLRVGTSVYLLPLRPAAVAAKQAVTLDHLSEGRFVFGLGIGGEFPREFDACGVDPAERGARLGEGIEVMRKLFGGGPVSHCGRFWRFQDVHMQPAPFTPGGPPLWGGGRHRRALERVGRLCDGWISYVVTPSQYREGLELIGAAADAAGRDIERFGTGHVLFLRMAPSRGRALEEAAAILSRRYAMDFRRAAERYCALGPPELIARSVAEFQAAGVRDLIIDVLGSRDEQRAQLEILAREVFPAFRA
jgi:alkanesulfonate monooxygenase SsuD/methylene tetrahydromethanopterin reductase-like flavin-dependent oxidoreductase (luciferase family)